MTLIPKSQILCSFEMQSMRVISDNAKNNLMEWDHGRWWKGDLTLTT